MNVWSQFYKIARAGFEQSFCHFRKKSLKIEDVLKLATIHHDITEVINVINQLYSGFVMLYFGGIFCLLNLFLFSLVITKSYYKDPAEAVMMTIANFEWNMYDIVLVLILIQSATAASSEGKNKATSLIYKIVNTSTDGKLNGRVSEMAFFNILNFLHAFCFPSVVDELFAANYIESFGFLLWTFQLWLAAVF